MGAAARIGLHRWRHVVKLDPDKPLPAETVRRIAASGTDAVLIGGTQRVTRAKVLRLLWRLRHAPVPVCIEVTAMACAVPGADAYLVPLALNSDDPRWFIGNHLEGLARVGHRVPWERVLAEGYIIANPHSAAARRAQAVEPSPARLAALVRFGAGILDLPVVYLEYSGRPAPDDMVAVAARSLRRIRAAGGRSRLFYGGGISDYDGARRRLQQVDAIVIGNALYDPRGLAVLEETLAARADSEREDDPLVRADRVP